MMKTEGHNPSVFVEYEWCEFLYETILQTKLNKWSKISFMVIPERKNNGMIPDDDYKIVETLKIKIISVFGVTVNLYSIKILSSYRNFNMTNQVEMKYGLHMINFSLQDQSSICSFWFNNRRFYFSKG